MLYVKVTWSPAEDFYLPFFVMEGIDPTLNAITSKVSLLSYLTVEAITGNEVKTCP